MKLYANVSSERATKGQGGNELKVLITNEQRENIACINAFYREVTQDILITFIPLNCLELRGRYDEKVNINTKTKRYIHELKGKKQKGDIELSCGHNDGVDLEGQCVRCGNTLYL